MEAQRRSVLRAFPRISNTAATSTCQASSPSEDVVRIVRWELEATGPASFYSRSSDATHLSVSLMQAIVSQEIENNRLHSVCTLANPRVHERTSSPFAVTRRLSPRYRDSSEWRAADDQKICFTCRHAGDVARSCHYSWLARGPTRVVLMEMPNADSKSATDLPGKRGTAARHHRVATSLVHH